VLQQSCEISRFPARWLLTRDMLSVQSRQLANSPTRQLAAVAASLAFDPFWRSDMRTSRWVVGLVLAVAATVAAGRWTGRALWPPPPERRIELAGEPWLEQPVTDRAIGAQGTFTVRNTGTETVTITGYAADCSCAAVSIPDKILPPGAVVRIQLRVSSFADDEDRYERAVVLRTDAGELRFGLRGSVVLADTIRFRPTTLTHTRASGGSSWATGGEVVVRVPRRLGSCAARLLANGQPSVAGLAVTVAETDNGSTTTAEYCVTVAPAVGATTNVPDNIVLHIDAGPTPIRIPITYRFE
jgi:hypothetical protein